ncbi:MAG: hypothetical protein HW397_369 [Dehalococcoidia bacterium]|nr:hypothetical protein [Dehalococcoidia bacterium]
MSSPGTQVAAAPKKKLFYGWIMVMAGVVNQMIMSGVGGQGFGTFILPLEREFGWSKSTLSAARALMQIENGLMGPFEGYLVDKLGPRIMTTLGMIVFGIGFIMLGFVHSLTMYFAAFFVVALGASLGGFVVLAVAINHWFRRRRTFAQSIAQTGMGFGGIILIPLLVWAQVEFGWRASAIGAGIISIAVGIPMGLLMRKSPEPYGLLPDGDSPNAPPTANQRTKGSDSPSSFGSTDFTLGEAFRTPAFWLIGLGHGLSVMVVGAVTTHQFAHMEMVEGVGLSRASSALVVTVLSAVNIGGRFLAGLVGDRYDKRYISAIGNVLGGIALLMFALADSLFWAMGYAVLFGISWGIRGPMMSSIRGDYFGRKHFGKILGSSSLITAPLSLIAPIFAGFMADWQGNYRLGFIILAFLSTLGAVMFLLAKPPKPPRRLIQELVDSTGG